MFHEHNVSEVVWWQVQGGQKCAW